jgi:chromosome segregation ATPase
MIESIMYFGIGVLVAALLGLVIIPLVHGRAVRLTMKRLEAAMPLSIAEVQADKDLLRAEFAMSTRRLEIMVEQLKTRSASQLSEVGRKGDAINRLKVELQALRDQLRTTEEESAAKAAALQDAERTLSDKESELTKLMVALDERSVLMDLQKTEIVVLRGQVGTIEAESAVKAAALQEAERTLSDKESELAKLTGALDERSVLTDSQKAEIVAVRGQLGTIEAELAVKVAALQEAERTLSDKESELTKLTAALDERSVLTDSQKTEIVAVRDRLITIEAELAVKAAALQDAEYTLSDKESELTKLTGALDERSVLTDSQKTEIVAVRGQLGTIEAELAVKAAALQDAERALSDKESELAKLTHELDVRSTLAEQQKTEIIALTTQVETLKEGLDGAREQLMAVEDRRDAERIELKATTQELKEERGKFEDFHRRVAELVQQLMAQSTKDEILIDLENRLVEQSQLLNEMELELKDLRAEIDIARKAEANLRLAIIEMDGGTHTATQTLKAEKEKLQGALDRANGERARLTHELANMKRQAKETLAA